MPPGGGADLTFPVTVPLRVGQVAVRAVARAGDLSDGELRPLPVLPGRLHLVRRVLFSESESKGDRNEQPDNPQRHLRVRG